MARPAMPRHDRPQPMLPTRPAPSPPTHAGPAPASRRARSTSLTDRLLRLTRPHHLAAAIAALFAVALPSYALGGDAVHVVVKGQTLKGIAKRHRISIDTLREVNGLRPGERIHPGLELVIPEKGHEAEAAKKAADRRAAEERERDKARRAKERDAAAKGGARAGRRDEERGGREEPYEAKPKRPGRVKFVRGAEHAEVQLLTRHGRLVPAALATVSRMLRFYPTGAKIPVDPRLATLIGLVSDHFGGRPFHVVSGFRPYSPKQYTPHSNHNLGRAFDFSIEGVPNTAVRDFCRTIHNAGVGWYPNSTFVHLDVRAQKAYWVDYSRSGEAPRYSSPVDQAAADESASEVDETGGTPAPSGSHGTLHPTEQAPDSTGGNPDTSGDASDSARKRGAGDPPPSP